MRLRHHLPLLAAFLLILDAASAQTHAPVGPGDARVIRQVNDYYTVVVNHSSAPMSAYAISILMYGSGQRIRHFYDARILGRPPIKPGGSAQESRRGILLGAKLLAAVFTDGTSYGDPKDLNDLMERRRAKLTAVAAVAAIVCDAQRKGTDLQIVVGNLEKRKSQLAAATPMLADIQAQVYTTVIDKIKGDSLHGSDAIGNAIQFVQASGAPLLEDPVRSPSGELYLKETPAVLSCGSSAAVSANSPARPASKPYSAHPLIALRDGFYVRAGLATDRWPPKPERVLRVAVSGNEIIVVELIRNAPPGAAVRERPIFHGTYITNPFQGDWGTSHGKMPMSVLSPESFLFGTEGNITANWNRLTDTAAR